MPGFINRRLLIVVGSLLTLVCLGAVLSLMDWQAAIALFSRLDAPTVALGLGFYFMSLYLRACRARLLLREADGQEFRVGELLPVVLWHNFYNRILPFRTGEATYVILLGKINGQTLERGLSSLLVSRLYDGAASVSLLAVCLLMMSDARVSGYSVLIAGLALCVLLGLFSLPWLLRSVSSLLKNLLSNPRMAPLAKVKASIDAIESQVRAVNRFGLVISLLAMSFGVWLSVYCFYTTLMVGFGLVSPDLAGLFTVIVGSTLSLFIYMLPINLASGPLEAGWTAGFLFVGLPSAAALSSGFGINAVTHLANILFILPLLGFWLKNSRAK